MEYILLIDHSGPTQGDHYFMMPREEYPYEEPKIGDVLSLQVSKTICRDEHTHHYKTLLDGVYAVVYTFPGTGKTIFPDKMRYHVPFEIGEDDTCYRVLIKKEYSLPEGVESLQPTPLEQLCN